MFVILKKKWGLNCVICHSRIILFPLNILRTNEQNFISKGEFQICPHMDFDNILDVVYLRYNNYKTKSFYSSKAVMPQGDTLMYTFFVLIYDLLNISLKSLTLLTSTFFEWNMKEDSQRYTLLPSMYMNTSR